MDGERPGHTAKELLRAAKEQDTPISKRLLADWVRKGLIDQATKRGRGRGKGIVATWPDRQRWLFLALLRKQKEGAVKKPATLTNMPVWLWLRFGEEHVPLRQVRRALRTWGQTYRTSSLRAARISAEGLAEQIAHPAATKQARETFIREIEKTSLRGRMDRQRLLAAARRLADPHEVLGRGILGITPRHEAVVMLIEARLEAIRILEHLRDEDLRHVRAAYATSRREYALEQPLTAYSAAIGDFVSGRGPQEEIGTACLDTITLIGLLVAPRRREVRGNKPK